MRRRVLVAGAVLLTLLAVLVLSRPRTDPYERPPLDPRGTGPAGTAGLVALLRESGVEVRLGGRPTAGDTVVLQLADRFSGEAADRLRTWVDEGGTLVTTDPAGGLAAPTEAGADVAAAPGPGCTLTALAGLGEVQPALPAVFPVEPGASTCFGDGDRAGVHARTLGDGLVVSVSDPQPLTNLSLDEGDSAALALTLLAPGPGGRVRILDPRRLVGDDGTAEGDGTVLGALPTRGRQAVAQVLVAFVVWGLVRGRRLGRPVTEELPVPLPASDLVLATGRLLDRNGDVGDAAELLRRRARRELGTAFGLGPDPVPTELADALVARARVDPGLVTAALLTPVGDEAALVATAAHLDRLHQELRP